MTVLLNRKFDELCRSGVCPASLLDVLSLLVSQANDAANSKTHDHSATTQKHHTPADYVMDSEEREAEARRHALVRAQSNSIEELSDALRSAHQSIVVAAERSLNRFAEDVKALSDGVVASAAKELRTLRESTKQDLEAFVDRACQATVHRTEEEMDDVRGRWLAGTMLEVDSIKSEVSVAGLQAMQEVRQLTESYAVYVSNAHDLVASGSMVDVHRALASSAFAELKADSVAVAAAPMAEVVLLSTRLQQVERSVARLGSGMSAVDDALGGVLTKADAAILHGVVNAQKPEAAAAALHGQTALKKRGGINVLRRSLQGRYPLGLALEAGPDGAVVTHVSWKLPGEITVGSVLTHVGRASVHTPEDVQARVLEQAATNSTIKLTLYDAETARVRTAEVDLGAEEQL